MRRKWQTYLDQFGFYVRRLLRRIRPAERTGLGSIPHSEGVTFRVWAPHADAVFVCGSFNDWSPWRHPLAREKEPEGQAGHFSADVAEAQVGDSYKYLIHYQEQTFLRTDPRVREVDQLQNGIVIDWDEQRVATAVFFPPSQRDLIIYELHTGTFPDTKRQVVGTFAGIIDKLPYLHSLGVNALELMPVAEFAGDYSWGYNVGHPFAVTRTYGGRAALQQLIQAAHHQGLAVLIDVVYNHFGPQALSLWRFDGWSENGLGGVYFYNDWRAKTPWADTRPDYGRPAVRQYLHDNALMWLDELGADGLRWDATSYIRNAHGHDEDSGADIAEGWGLMQRINADIQENRPGKISIAEDMQNNPALIQPISAGGAGFQAQWDARFAHTLRRNLLKSQDEARDMNEVATVIAGDYNGDPWRRVIFTESHDEVANGQARIPEEIDPGHARSFFARKRAALGLAIVLTAPGIPLLFQGQEFLESGWFDDQVPLDWSKAERNAGFIRLVQDLIHLRRNRDGRSPGLQADNTLVYHINNNDKLLAFRRWQTVEGDDGVADTVVVANFANRFHPGYTIGLPQPGLWSILFNSDLHLYDLSFSDHHCPDVIAAPVMGDKNMAGGFDYWGNVTIAPYTVLILGK